MKANFEIYNTFTKVVICQFELGSFAYPTCKALNKEFGNGVNTYAVREVKENGKIKNESR